ncbi:hypothetical protein CDIK_1510 [Cucumispora dikerogammari]|nr:hypothetical protein CDIK_1510 [Cucumispora dikerogammari]
MFVFMYNPSVISCPETENTTGTRKKLTTHYECAIKIYNLYGETYMGADFSDLTGVYNISYNNTGGTLEIVFYIDVFPFNKNVEFSEEKAELIKSSTEKIEDRNTIWKEERVIDISKHTTIENGSLKANCKLEEGKTFLSREIKILVNKPESEEREWKSKDARKACFDLLQITKENFPTTGFKLRFEFIVTNQSSGENVRVTVLTKHFWFSINKRITGTKNIQKSRIRLEKEI